MEANKATNAPFFKLRRMKKAIGILAIGLAAVACQAPQETSTVSSVFETNCETVRTVIDNLQNEVVSFEHYSEDFVGAQTMYNSKGDSTRLEEFKTNRINWYKTFDAELTTPAESRKIVITKGMNLMCVILQKGLFKGDLDDRILRDDQYAFG